MSERMSDERLKQLDAAWSDEVRARRLGAVAHTLDRRSGGLARSPWVVLVRSLAHGRSRLIRDQSVECRSDGVRRVMVDTLGVRSAVLCVLAARPARCAAASKRDTGLRSAKPT